MKYPNRLTSRTGVRRLAVLPLVLVFSLLAVAAPPLVPPAANLDNLQAREMKRHLTFLASPELGGRYTLGAGNKIAARYLASNLESFGFRGAMPDGSFFQPIPFERNELDAANSFITIGDDPTRFPFADGFASMNLFSTPKAFDVTGELVFVGYGISMPEAGYDDYAGLETKGKIAVMPMQTALPKALGGKFVPEANRGVKAAAAHGCVGVMVLPDAYVDNWSQIVGYIKNYGGKQARLAKPKTADAKPDASAPGVMLAPATAAKVLEKFGLTHDTVRKAAAAGEPLKPAVSAVKSQVKVAALEKAEYGQNVVGVLEGRDPVLKNEYVVLSAHYDHLDADGKNIYPGADDDGSGTTAVLEIARTFSKGIRPRRSIFVLFNTGEEMGLLGSQYFTDQQPLVPLSQIVLDLNVDMIGRVRAEGDTTQANSKLADKDTIYLIGPDKHSTELMSLSEQVNQEVTKLKFDYTYNNEADPSRLFYRSDHWNFAKKGIPIIFYFSGLHVDYHKPSDTVDKIDFDKMTRVARLIYATGWNVANRPQRLKIDKWKPEQAKQTGF